MPRPISTRMGHAYRPCGSDAWVTVRFQRSGHSDLGTSVLTFEIYLSAGMRKNVWICEYGELNFGTYARADRVCAECVGDEGGGGEAAEGGGRGGGED